MLLNKYLFKKLVNKDGGRQLYIIMDLFHTIDPQIYIAVLARFFKDQVENNKIRFMFQEITLIVFV